MQLHAKPHLWFQYFPLGAIHLEVMICFVMRLIHILMIGKLGAEVSQFIVATPINTGVNIVSALLYYQVSNGNLTDMATQQL
jgi:hypothetical protein